MELDVKDIEAVGRSRANRFMPQGIKNWMYTGVVATGIGLVFWMLNNNWMALVVAVIGCGIVLYSNIQADKWRKHVISDVKREWYDRQVKESGKR